MKSTEFAKASPTSRRDTLTAQTAAQHVGSSVCQGIRIKGEITGSEDLFVDGHIEGQIDLDNASVTIGSNGIVKAGVNAREVIVRGRVEGKIFSSERIQILSTGHISGEIHCERIAIEDGGVLRGKVEAGRPPVKTAETRSLAAGAGMGSGKNAEEQRTSITTATPAAEAKANVAAAGGTAVE